VTSNPTHHVLVIDDESLNRDLLRRVLQSHYELSEACDAAEAVELLESADLARVHLILCDHLMPGMTGAELAGIARERWPSIVFMLITGYDGDDEIQQAVDDGSVHTLLSKPWRSKALIASIASCIAEFDAR
jgi:two-component system response regulator HupR/HoxA